MFSKADSVKFKIMNFPNCLSNYRRVSDEKYKTSFSSIAIQTIILHNYNRGQSEQGIVIGVIP